MAHLIAVRNQKRISQVDLAKNIGMTQAQLAKIEGLSSNPSLKTLDRYPRGLGLVMTISFVPEKKESLIQ